MSAPPSSGKIVQDPDVGPTKQQPSTQDQLDKSELAIRTLKIRHAQKQAAMIEEANEITKHPKAKR